LEDTGDYGHGFRPLRHDPRRSLGAPQRRVQRQSKQSKQLLGEFPLTLEQLLGEFPLTLEQLFEESLGPFDVLEQFEASDFDPKAFHGRPEAL
jgi:hypothetical protein